MSQYYAGGARAELMQRAALAVAAAFGLVGILGFVPGVTAHYDRLQFAGHMSGAELFGLFGVSVLHNVVHLLFAVVGVVSARTARGARAFLIGGGIVYLLLTAFGLVVDRHDSANFVPLNQADNWLHLGLGVAMIAVAMIIASRDRIESTQTQTEASR